MAQNSTEIELEPLVFSEDELQDIADPVEPVKEFTLVPEGDSSSAVVDGYTDAETLALEIKAAEKRAAISKPVGISKVSLTSEIIDDFRLNFGSKASEALARDLTKTFEQDYAEQISENPDFFSYELLQSGKAAFFDQLPPSYTMEVNGEETPIRDMLPAERAARFNNPDAISALLSNADIGSLPRAFLSEFFKSGPSTYVGTQAAKAAAAAAFKTPPTSVGNFVLKGLAPVAAFLGGSYLLYEGADAIEEGLIGPDQVVLPGQKYAVEAMRTAGGSVAATQFPFLMGKQTSTVARDVLANLAEDAPRPVATRLTAAIEGLIENIGQTAKGSKVGAGLTVASELTAGLGSTVGAMFAEDVYPGSTFPRLGFEFLGGNTFAATLSKLLPKAYSKMLSQTAKNLPEGEENDAMKFINNIATGKQQKLFSRMNELYELHDGNYEAMMADLTNTETNQILKEVFPDVDFTAGQRLDDDSSIIMMVEAAMANDNPELNAARMKADRNAKVFFDKWIKGLLADGSQDALKTAAFLRKNMFSDAIRLRLTSAIDKRVKAVAQLQKSTVEDAVTQEQFSIKIGETLDAQTRLGRLTETNFWDKVGQFNVFEAEDIMDTDFTPSFIRQYDEMLKKLDFQGGYFKKAFIKDHAVFHNTIQNMKRSLGIDIREGLKQQDAIVGRLLGSNPDVISKLFSNDVSELKRAQAGLTPFKDTASATRVLQEIKKGKLGTEKLSQAEQKIMVAYTEAQVKRLQLEAAKLDPERLIGVSASDLIKLRRAFRNEAINFHSGATTKLGNAEEARNFGEMSEKILDDMNSVPEGANDAYQEAIAYSYAFNEVHTRSLVGRARAKTAMGAHRLPPELLTQEFLKGNPNLTNLRVKDLQAVAEFANKQGFEGATETFTTINNLIESSLREARKEAVSADGTVNANKLNNWKRNNAELLEKFPVLKRDLENAVAAQRTFDVWSARSAKGKSLVNSQVYLSTILRNTSPTAAVADALNFIPKGGQSKNPVQGLARLFRFSRMSFRDAAGKLLPEAEQEIRHQALREGYQDAILQYAFMTSGGESIGTFDPMTFHKTLFGTLSGEGISRSTSMPSYLDKQGSKESLVSVAQKYGLFDEKLLVRMRTISNQMVRLAAADAAGKLNDPNLQKQAGPIFDFYVGMVGLAGGSKAYQALTGGQGGTGSISAAAAGKRFILELFKDLPASQRMSVFQLVFTDPVMAANLLRKPQTAKEVANQFGRIKQFFLEKGFSVTGGQSPYIQRELYEDEDRGTGMTKEEMMGEEPKQQKRDIPGIDSPVVQRNSSPAVQTVSARSPVAPTDGATSAPEPRPFIVAQMPTAQQPSAPQARPSDRSGVASLLPAGGAQSNASSQERYAAAYPYDSISDVIRMRGTA
jgi:hypothetical protein